MFQTRSLTTVTFQGCGVIEHMVRIHCAHSDLRIEYVHHDTKPLSAMRRSCRRVSPSHYTTLDA